MVNLSRNLWATVQNGHAMMLGGAAELVKGLVGPDLAADLHKMARAGARIIRQERPLDKVVEQLQGQLMGSAGSELLKVSAHRRKVATG